MRSSTLSNTRRAGLAGLVFVASLLGAAPAVAQTGGSGPPGTTTSPTTTTAPAPSGTAQIQPGGTATPPANAPTAVRRAIKAANKIHTRPYVWGGGHGSFKSRGYDCSGSVSYVLHHAGLLSGSARPSGGFTNWGFAGSGRWVTVYANSGHMWLKVAGLRFDTTDRERDGTRWHRDIRSSAGYAVRHPGGIG